MKRNNNLELPSEELALQRFKDGVRFVDPNKMLKRVITVKEVFNSNFNVYLMDADRIIKCNDECAQMSGYDNALQANRTSLYEHPFVSAQSLNEAVSYNKEVMRKSRMLIKEENIVMDEEISKEFLSIKMPYYNENGQVIGVFGTSMGLGIHSLSESINRLRDFGIMNTNINSLISCTEMFGVHLSRRQMACLRFAIRGKTSKEIASLLGISYRTVEHHFVVLKRKLAVSSKAELLDKVMDYFQFDLG